MAASGSLWAPPRGSGRTSSTMPCSFMSLAVSFSASAASAARPASRKMIEAHASGRSEEHTSELQSRQYLVCRLLLEKKKNPHHHLLPAYPLYHFLRYPSLPL